MSPEHFGKLLYDNFLLDVPRLMDLSVVFHPTNPVLVEKMVSNVVQHNPAYLQDIQTTANVVRESLRKAEERLGQFCKTHHTVQDGKVLLTTIYYKADQFFCVLKMFARDITLTL